MINFIKNYIDKKVEEKFQEKEHKLNKQIDNVVDETIDKFPEIVKNIIQHAMQDIKNTPNPSGIAYTLKTTLTPFILRALESELKEIKDKNKRIYKIKTDAKKMVRELPKDEDFIQEVIDSINKKQLKK